MANATLIAHAGSRKLTFAELKALPSPARLGSRHLPIRYDEMVSLIEDRAVAVGVGVKKAEYAVSKDDGKLFATFVFDGLLGESEGIDRGAYALGLRGSTDSSLAWRGVAGLSVFVCDNLAMSGSDFLFNKKSTLNLRLESLVRVGFSRFLGEAKKLGDGIKRLSEKVISTEEAKAHIYDAIVVDKALPLRLLPGVHDAYFHSKKLDYPEVVANFGNVWGLHNAMTRVIKGIESPNLAQLASRKVGAHFGI